MNYKCITCGSYAINHDMHDRDGTDGNLCDVHYWKKRAEGKRVENADPVRPLLHPEPRTYDWTELERKAIAEYATASYQAGHNAGVQHHKKAMQEAIGTVSGKEWTDENVIAWCVERGLRSAQPVQPATPTTRIERARRLYEQHPTYRGAQPIPWSDAPKEVRREWLAKAKVAQPIQPTDKGVNDEI